MLRNVIELKFAAFIFQRNFPQRRRPLALETLKYTFKSNPLDVDSCLKFIYRPDCSSFSGAFIIPFFIMLIVVGMPLLLLELGLGQKLRVGAAGAWKKVR